MMTKNILFVPFTFLFLFSGVGCLVDSDSSEPAEGATQDQAHEQTSQTLNEAPIREVGDDDTDELSPAEPTKPPGGGCFCPAPAGDTITVDHCKYCSFLNCTRNFCKHQPAGGGTPVKSRCQW